jgi:glycosyltransferase involved in cell wall biosynthesis
LLAGFFMPLFSVIIPTYNRRKWLLRCIGSVHAQRFTDYEIVVVDDGSTDGSIEALAELGGRIRLIKQQNRGPAAARSAGARVAVGEYIAFLDSDDRWFPWTLSTLAAAAERFGHPAWLYGGGVVANQFVEPTVSEAPFSARFFKDYVQAALLEGLMPLPTGVAISRALFVDSGGFRETMRVAEDLDLWFRIGGAPGFVLVDSPPIYVREVHGGNLGEDVALSYEGMLQLVARERRGIYGGPAESTFLHRAIITRQLMYYSRTYRERGHSMLAARFYCELLRLQARSRFREPRFGGKRNRYLLTFPVFVLSPALHGWLANAFSAGQKIGSRGIHDRG